MGLPESQISDEILEKPLGAFLMLIETRMQRPRHFRAEWNVELGSTSVLSVFLVSSDF